MSRIETIEKEVASLSGEELAVFRAWVGGLGAGAGGVQMGDDGRLGEGCGRGSPNSTRQPGISRWRTMRDSGSLTRLPMRRCGTSELASALTFEAHCFAALLDPLSGVAGFGSSPCRREISASQKRPTSSLTPFQKDRALLVMSRRRSVSRAWT
jgi:hypothetical protein